MIGYYLITKMSYKSGNFIAAFIKRRVLPGKKRKRERKKKLPADYS